MYNLRHSNNLQHNAYQGRVGSARAQVQDGRTDVQRIGNELGDPRYNDPDFDGPDFASPGSYPGLRIEGSS
jgi:hypothetical protein